LIQAPCPLRSPSRASAAVPPRIPQGSKSTARNKHDAAPLPARQRTKLKHPLIRAVTTGLSPMQTTREECGASAAQRVPNRPDRAGCAAMGPQHEVAGKSDTFGVDKAVKPLI
jgi:hypothetical protein